MIKQAVRSRGGGRVGHKLQRLELTPVQQLFRSPQHGPATADPPPARRLHELGTC
jgi:hypothetical protein